jgi:hypothetical protein
MSSYEIPSHILYHFIIPYAEQCYLISVEYHYVDLNKLMILLLKDCRRVSGVIHINLNDIIGNLVEKYKIYVVNRDWLVQETLFAINRVLQSYFYHRAEFDLASPKP